MRFLAATSSWPQDSSRDHAPDAAHRLANARLDIIHVTGGDDATLAKLCQRLLPGRVDPAVLSSMCPGAGAARQETAEGG